MIRFPEPAFTLSLNVRTRLAPTATLAELSAGTVIDKAGGVVSASDAVVKSKSVAAERPA